MHPDWTRSSYSQFGEDAVLQAYFRNKAHEQTGDQQNFRRDGTYVDIGCFHPHMISNTRWLYEQGWRGINVDATPGVKDVFDAARPEDTNLTCAISDSDGYASFISFGPHSVLNYLAPPSHPAPAGAVALQVPTMTLASLVLRHLPAGRQVDFLSVDAEGHDLAVLASGNWNRDRPDLVMVEFHAGAIDEILHSDLYGFMISKDYKLYAWTPPTLIFERVA